MLDGIIIKGIGGFYYVLSKGVIYECKARGIFRKNKITPLAGDRVKIEAKGVTGSICEILPRSSMLVRPPAANINMLVIVISALFPEPNLMLVDKMLVQAKKNNIEAVICINKTDLGERRDIVDIYEKAGYKVLCVSAEKNEGLEKLYELIEGKIAAFSGASGVGKSSILNAITNAGMETGELSDRIQRGKNTTRHVELIPVRNGFVIDTPGFSSLELEGVEPENLVEFFPEIYEKTDFCKFRDCNHLQNQNNCAVKDAVENGEISESRYNSYCSLYNLLKKS